MATIQKTNLFQSGIITYRVNLAHYLKGAKRVFEVQILNHKTGAFLATIEQENILIQGIFQNTFEEEKSISSSSSHCSTSSLYTIQETGKTLTKSFTQIEEDLAKENKQKNPWEEKKFLQKIKEEITNRTPKLEFDSKTNNILHVTYQ